jgi:hypothetical protein
MICALTVVDDKRVIITAILVREFVDVGMRLR